VFARHVSSHGFGVTEAIELGSALGRIPERLVVYGIVAGGFENGHDISPAVRRAIDQTSRAIVQDLHLERGKRGVTHA